MKIHDIVTRNENTQFVNDVQISSFRSDLNSELASSYIFTSRSGGGRRSSTEILETVVQSYLPGGVDENRFVVIATYGHGKSHFGLAMANYFGQPARSPVLESVLENLRHAAPDDAAAQRFRTFRDNKVKPFLVLILRGDETGSLRQRTLRGLELAFADCAETRGVRPPSWFLEAERLLKEVVLPRRSEANEWLAQHELDVSILQARVASRDDVVYTLFQDLVRALTRVEANLQARTNLAELVQWTCDTFCGDAEDKPFSGLLVLFDEFSTFVAEYANQSADGTPLQELLNGISGRRGLAAFVALAQHDPDTVAANELRFDGGNTRLDSIKRELDRLPGPFRFRMYSSLETVLDAYLKQSKPLMRKLLSDPRSQQSISEATDIAFDVYRERYVKRLSWSAETFQKNVTEGCFPLHPLATAIISDIDLQSTSNPRSILGFVLESIQRKGSESVVNGGRINWIQPIELVDYFKDMLGPEWAKYKSAVGQVGADQPEEYRAVLKAMLLQAAAQMPTQQAGGYAKVVASLAGITAPQAQQALRRLLTPGYIRFDPHQNTYSFWPENQGAYLIEQRLADLADKNPLSSSVMQEINELLEKDGVLQRIEPSRIEWGSPADWAAGENVIRATELEYRQLKELTTMGSKEASDRQRAVVVYVVAEKEEEVDSLKDRVPEALDHQYGPRIDAIVVFRPTRPYPEAVRGLYRYWLLRTKFSNRLQADVGPALYEAEVERFKLAAEDVLSELRSNSVAVVPATFRAQITSLRRADAAQVLAELERLAYSENPGHFVTNQKLASHNLRNAVWSLALPLARNALKANRDVLRQQAMTDDILTQHLMQRWGVVASNYRLQVPEGKPAHSAWELLDREFQPSKAYNATNPVVLRLMSIPYGFDTNTLTLLLCSWIGFHRADLILASQEARTFDELIQKNTRPKDFISQFSQVKIRRLDPNALRDEVRELAVTVKSTRVSIEFAESAIERIKALLDDDRLSSVDAQSAEQTLSKLKADLETAKEYDEIANSILNEGSGKDSRSTLLGLRNVERLPVCGIVEALQPSPAEIRRRVLSTLAEQVEQEVAEALEIDGLPAFEASRSRLEQLKTALAQAGLEDMVRATAKGLAGLEKTKTELVARAEDSETVKTLEATQLKISLIDLRADEPQLRALHDRAQSEEVAERVADRLHATQTRIKSLTGAVTTLESRVHELASQEELERVNSELTSKFALYQDTPEYDRLQPLQMQIEQLRGAFAELGRLTRSQVSSPEAVADIKKRLQELHDAMPHEAQKKLCSAASTIVDKRAEQERSTAARWFTTRTNTFKSGDFSRRFLDDLAAMPPFLADDHRVEVGRMLGQAHTRLEEDEVEKLVSAFKMIESPERQRQCLERLTALVG